MSLEKKFISQISHYFTGYALSHALGFITFPILTRILIVKDYGLLSLVTTTMTLGLSIANLGLHQSLIRYYSDFQNRKDKSSLFTYYSTFFLSSLFLGICGSLLFLIVAQTFLRRIVGNEAAGILSFVSISILLGCISVSLNSFLRVEQKTKLFNFLSVTGRIVSYGLSFIFLYFLIGGLYGFFFGSMLAQFIFIVVLTKYLFKNNRISFQYFSFPFLKQAIMYGLPFTMLEVSHGLLNFGDRYLIQYYLDSEALGLYSAAYTLSMQIVQIVDYPILSVVPIIYFELWADKGSEAVQDFLKNALTYFAIISFPIMFGIIAVSKELVVLIASQKFAESAAIMPFVVIGGLIFASSTFFSAGLYIHKKTIIPATAMLISVLINFGLNYFLIPKYGITGAAIATLVGYVSYVLLIIPIAFRYLSYMPDFKALARYAVYSAVMLLIIMQINLQHGPTNLLIKVSAGIIVYSLMILMFEAKIKKLVSNIFSGK